MINTNKAKEGLKKVLKIIKSCTVAAFSRFRANWTQFSGHLKVRTIWLNMRIYSRIILKFTRELPANFIIFARNLPQMVNREGSRVKFYRNKFELKNILPHLGIGILAVAVLSTNVFAQDMGYHSPIFMGDIIEPSEISDLAIEADKYTPFINESDNVYVQELARTKDEVVSDENYIIAPARLTTEISPKETVPTPIATRTAFVSYQMLGGETLSLVGAKFGVTVQSIISANSDIKDPNLVQPGTSILIPPCDGITHVVSKGENLAGVVTKYSGNLDDTLRANAIEDPSKIFAGERIIVPGGKQPKAPVIIAKKNTSKVKGATSSPTGPTVPSGTFIWPTSGSVCQGFRSGHPAIDICAGGASPPIVASDGGVVVQASYGWNWGYGNTVLIDHGNGFQTRYAHLRVLNVSSGQRVSQGQRLGFMGTTGNSTGVHLHFEIHMGAARLNPLAYIGR